MIDFILTKFQNLRFGDFRSLQATPLKPIRARDVQVRHQVDLTDLGKRGRVELKGMFIDMYCPLWMFSVGSFGLDLFQLKIAERLRLS